MKTTFIQSLPISTQNEIKKDLQKALQGITLDTSIEEEIETAMGCRLCDLEDTININKYL